MKKGSRIGISVLPQGQPEMNYVFERTIDGNLLTAVDQLQDVDFTFRAPEVVLDDLLKLQSSDIGEIGVHIFKDMMSSVPQERRIHLKVNIGVFGIAKNGYLGVIALGGKAVASFLARHGMSLSMLKAIVQKFKD